jgi:hypothetical protein
MHMASYCFIQAKDCADRAGRAPDTKLRQFLRHLQDSWLTAARNAHVQNAQPAEIIALHRLPRPGLRVVGG